MHGRFLLLGVVTLVSIADAGIIGTTGNVAVLPAATANYRPNPYNDPAPAPIRLWAEQTGIGLPANAVLDTDLPNPIFRYVTGAVAPGEAPFTPGGGPTIPAGTLVDVYFAYFDPAADTTARGTVTFSTPVLGMVAFTERLPFTDYLRVPGAPYPVNPAFNARGWENPEWGHLSADRRTLEFFSSAGNPGDQFRIFVSAVPEPSTWLMLGTGLIALARFRRRRN
jgi:hypothetical protein